MYLILTDFNTDANFCEHFILLKIPATYLRASCHLFLIFLVPHNVALVIFSISLFMFAFFSCSVLRELLLLLLLITAFFIRKPQKKTFCDVLGRP